MEEAKPHWRRYENQ